MILRSSLPNYVFSNSFMMFCIFCRNVITGDSNIITYDFDLSFYNLSDLHTNRNHINQTNKHLSNSNWPVLGLSVFSIFGVIGNVLVCLTIRRDQALQTSVNYYLFSLAIADLAVCLIVITFSLIQDFKGNHFRIHKLDLSYTNVLYFSIKIR